MTESEIPQEILDYMDELVKRAETIVENLCNTDVKVPENCPPFYIDILGMAYAMALSFGLQEGQPEDSLHNHLARTSASAKLSMDENKKMIGERVHH